MTWVKLDDNFADHPAIAPLSDQAFRLHIAALCYCARYLTDGLVPDAFVGGRQRKTAAELVSHGRWLVEVDGWSIHDFLDYQESREKVLSRRDAAAKRKQKQRSHSVTDTVTDNGTHAGTHADSHTTPDPTRTTYISSPSGRDRPGEPNPSVSYAKADAEWRARAAEEPTPTEAKQNAPAGLLAARERLKKAAAK